MYDIDVTLLTKLYNINSFGSNLKMHLLYSRECFFCLCVFQKVDWSKGRRGETSLSTRQEKGKQGEHFHAIIYRVSFTAQHVLCPAKLNVINKKHQCFVLLHSIGCIKSISPGPALPLHAYHLIPIQIIHLSMKLSRYDQISTRV